MELFSEFSPKGSFRVSSSNNSIFEEINSLSQKFQAINLGQGAPDFPGPDKLRKLLSEEFLINPNQYAHLAGVQELREALSSYIKSCCGMSYDPEHEITITAGASEGIFTTIMALVNPGDGVIVFEPAFDLYFQAITHAGGKILPVKLHPPDSPEGLRRNSWVVDWEALEAAFLEKPKMIIVNTPHNPTGKVFNYEEIGKIAELARKNDVYVLSDEVYENLTYDDKKAPFVSFCQEPSVNHLLIRVSSAAKTFGFTGMKVGWVSASKALTKFIRLSHQTINFCVNPCLQSALAKLMKDEKWLYNYLNLQKKEYFEKKILLGSALERAGFGVFPSEGTFFLSCHFYKIRTDMDDKSFCRFLIEEKRLAVIPLSYFYVSEKPLTNWLRVSFCKSQETLLQGVQHLLD